MDLLPWPAAFYGCSSIQITVEEGNANYSSYKGSLYNKEETILISGAGGSIVEILPTVTIIGNGAFYNHRSLTSITIPSSVTSIESSAFYGTDLTSVIFKNLNGWWYTSDETATSGTSISATDLENTTTAATYLRSSYGLYYWKKS